MTTNNEPKRFSVELSDQAWAYLCGLAVLRLPSLAPELSRQVIELIIAVHQPRVHEAMLSEVVAEALLSDIKRCGEASAVANPDTA